MSVNENQQETPWRIAIDTGGTFTDCIAYSPEGKTHYAKVLSNSTLRGEIEQVNGLQVTLKATWLTYGNIFEGYSLQPLGGEEVFQIVGMDAQRCELTLSEPFTVSQKHVQVFAGEEAPILAARLITQTALHQSFPPMQLRIGSTKGTNALLEHKGAKTAFITNQGLEDVLEIGTQQRSHLFQLDIPPKKPFYTKAFGISARINARGDELNSYTSEEISTLIQTLKEEKYEAVAIALMHSYRYSALEQQLKIALQNAEIPFVSCSQELAPLIKLIPRATTATINAYLAPIIEKYLGNIAQHVAKDNLWVMSSAGSLEKYDSFQPKDSLLSGPAGGVVGAALAAKTEGFHKILTLDMGGTSTDVAHYNAQYDYQFTTTVGEAQLFSPSLYIETVAAGGGSLCIVENLALSVGPESEGANPGPACYGNGGRLTVTDVNLLLGRTDATNFGIPIQKEAAERAFQQVKLQLKEANYQEAKDEEILSGLLDIANEKMASAIRKISVDKGYDPKEYALLAFGGAGGQHATEIAEVLGIETVLIPYEAGVLSALGISKAQIEKFASRQVLQPLREIEELLSKEFQALDHQLIQEFKKEAFAEKDIAITNRWLYLRLKGQETSLEIEWQAPMDIAQAFKTAYINMYQHWIDYLPIEVESIKVKAVRRENSKKSRSTKLTYEEEADPKPLHFIPAYFSGNWHKKMPVFKWESIKGRAKIHGPALLVSNFNTSVIPPLWRLEVNEHETAVLTRQKIALQHQSKKHTPEAIALALFTNRFSAIASEMGALLERTAFSVNVKERLDFSCALLDAEGMLLANAPHIPVHLGSLGICTRKVHQVLHLQEGDIAMTNHPAYGGSHLPDITLIAPIYFKGERIGFVSNRAHHAELGGKRPGSMPPDATSLEEEGVVFPPTFLFKRGEAQWEQITKRLQEAKFPSRAVDENLADLRAATASLTIGIQKMQELATQFGKNTVLEFMQKIKHHSAWLLKQQFEDFPQKEFNASEKLDDGTPLVVQINYNDSLTIDFTGTGHTHPQNLNANPSIVNSVVMYVLRLLVNKNIPLNEGLMENVKVIIPKGTLLNPIFPENPVQCPAVVGGNTETSQRLTDTLLKAFQLAACSQGTMNNFLFGNDEFGYYETICGGTGAGNRFHGASAVHQHMTNTRITDPEILEFRYPVILEKFGVRENSGGKGKWKGGDGIERVLKFTQPMSITTLMQHRKQAPYGLHGGENGAVGQQWLEKADGQKITLEGTDQVDVSVNDKIIILTPGGGGWGKS